jgi:outer membrane autotransporter protein
LIELGFSFFINIMERKMIKFAKYAVVAAISAFSLVMVSSNANAQTYSCSDSVYGSSGSYATYANECGDTSNQASSVTTSTTVLATAAGQSSKLIANRIAAASDASASLSFAQNGFSASTGMSAGSGRHGYTAWVSGSWSDVEDDNTDTAFDGDVYTVMAGLDRKVDDKVLVGLSVGWENTDIDTAYNGNSTTGQDGNLDGDGWTIAPYISYAVQDHVTASLVAGYSDIEYDTLRFDPNTGNRITGSTDADRIFVSAALTGNWTLHDKWTLRGSGSVFWATEDKDGYTETEAGGTTITQASYDADLGQFLLDARLGYDLGGVEPYALVGGEFDFTKDEANVGAGQSQASFDDEDFGAKFGGGLNLKLSDQVSGGIEAYTVEFRDDYEEVTGTASLRIKF